MQTVLQTNFNGIDGLELTQIDKPTLTANGVIVEMDLVPISPTDIKRESNPNATQEALAQLPRTIGYSGTGTVVEVGENRDPALRNRRVLVMHPTGSYSDHLVSENPDWLFPLPDAVDNKSAATLTATPYVLLDAIMNATAHGTDSIVITGANSVIGQYLLQLLAHETDFKAKIWPIVSPSSATYFEQQFPEQAHNTATTLPQLNRALIVDIAGSTALIEALLPHIAQPTIVSIALMHYQTTVPFQFVHEEFKAEQYRALIQQLASKQLTAPVGRIFPVTEIKRAQHFVQDTHSRGRVLVSFH